MSDFGVCYRSGKRIIQGETLYQASDRHLQYKYSPSAAVFFSLLAFFPYEIAKLIWYFLELYLLFLILILSYDILPVKLKKKGLVVILSFFVLARFFAREIELGQVNIFIFFLLMMMIKAVLKKSDIKGGLFWGFSLLFKPYAVVFLPYFILKKRFKLIATGCGMVALGLVLPVIFYGFRGNIVVLKGWQRTLSQSTPNLLYSYDNASIHAFWLKIFSAEKREIALMFIICTTFLIGFSLLRMMFLGERKSLRVPEVLEFSFLLVLIPFFSPLGWYYIYLYSLLAVVFLINFIDKFPPVLKYIFIANLVIIGTGYKEILGRDVFHFYTQYALLVINHLIILFYLFYSRVKMGSNIHQRY